MSAAWDGYEAHRRGGGRRKRRWRGWFAGAVALVIVAAAWLGMARGWPQSIFPGVAAHPDSPLQADHPADYAVVVYNEKDPLSRDLAYFYAEKRGIPEDRLVALRCPGDEEILRQEYDETIAAPLRAAFDARHWWHRTPDREGAEPSSTVTDSRIRFLVLMRGVPLRIKPAAGYPGDFSGQPPPIGGQNAASVDSELAVLGLFTRGISGVLPNPNFHSYNRFGDNPHPGVLLTGRLDAPTGTMVRRMIEDSIQVEKTGLWGRCYVDALGITDPKEGYYEGDVWMRKIAAELAPRRLPTVLDNRKPTFPAPYPLDEAAVYFGWYAEQPTGPFTRDDFRFQPGAVACHIHSYSATSVREPFKWWVGPLLNRGADAVLGNVYEPYLHLTTHLDLFAERLFDGYTLAESAWEATPALSWMNVVVGDPLYRPGKVWKDLEFDLGSPAAPGEPALATEGRAYLQGAQTWHNKGAKEGAAALEKSGARLHSGRIYEGLAGLQAGAGDVARAAASYEKAARLYKDPADGVRVCLTEARLLADSGQTEHAGAVLAAARSRYGATPAASLLADLAVELGVGKP